MKAILTFVLVLCMAVSVSANCCVEYDKDCCDKLTAKWQEYKDTRAIAKEQDSVLHYRKAAELAIELERPDIASWQYNNAAYTLIKQFIKSRDEGNIDYELLDSAMDFLIKAKNVDIESSDVVKTKIIEKNMAYVKAHLKEKINGDKK